jgi:PAS domain S-box-containing protein
MKKPAPQRSVSALERQRAQKVSPLRPGAVPEEQAAWLAELVASSDDAIIGKNLKGIVTSWNGSAQRIFGYAAEEAIGRSILFLIPVDRRREEESILSRIAAGRHVQHYETIRRRNDGSLVDVSLTVSPIKDASGRIVGASKIARDISDRKKSEQLLLAAYAALLESEKQILAVSEAERRRIGADLHDNLGQQLTAIEMLCNSLREDVRNQPELESQMRRICGFLRNSVTQTRRLARGLMPVSLTADGLVDGLAEMVRHMNHGPVRCDFICASKVRIGDNSVAEHLFHIAQEAVNNAVKHGQPQSITVILSQDKVRLRLRIEDDGAGFPRSRKAEAGVGLQIMQHRANVIGATLDTKSIRGKGITISCTLKNPA